MKTYLKMYLNKNLGDDLFLYIFKKRYKDRFLSLSLDDYSDEEVICLKKYKIINKVIKILSFNHFSLEYFLMKRSDLVVILGGSMFIEGKSKALFYNWLGKKKYYILGSNFGPYNSESYYSYFKDVFSKAEDVCFREKYSYDLFKDLSNVRYASDIVFSLDTSDINITNRKRVVISVIDCYRKFDIDRANHYEMEIVNLINLFDKKGYEVVLMSFCKAEGDEKAIESILGKIDNSLRDRIVKYFYNGNIDEALDMIGDSSVVVGSRFHANILGLLMNKTVIPIVYSDKTIHVLEDVEFKGKMFDIRDDFDVLSLTDKDLLYRLDINKQKKEAEKQFKELDNVLIRR